MFFWPGVARKKQSRKSFSPDSSENPVIVRNDTITDWNA